ncbi:beta-lactamase/transpeptidase-like protein [Durotheca rogersii]|uniref:beta-lactamase/transpeptidase-like protein n=1 Tax=Durotheca rogersii TaxID=419775 RepID=UPI00221FE2B2|nr:beta-lactamase/transpeptidase-like protein [Durotheca rogersii]KAI5864316.1 beta-lactamase/transpeptidase-like protein [Durotheca rogersii]
MTKLHTSVAALQLVEKGLVTVDEDVSRLLPSFAEKEILTGFGDDGAPSTRKRKNPITLRLLLTHSAGAGYDFMSGDLAKVSKLRGPPKNPGTIDDAFDLPLLYEPGEAYAYSSSIDRVGQVIEKLTGQKLEDYMRQNIWEPLGMENTTFFVDNHPEIKARRVPMAFRADPSQPVVENADRKTFTTGLKEAFGGQGLLSSIKDYIKILHSLLVDDEKLLKKETAAALFQPQLTPASKASLLEQMKNPEWAVGDWPLTNEYDWGLGGILVDGDKHPYRKRGALLWGGAANLTWFIDRTAGVCGTFGTQVMPPSDPQVRPIFKAFEEETYRRAGKL